VFRIKDSDSDQERLIGQLTWKNAAQGPGNSELIRRTSYQLRQVSQASPIGVRKCQKYSRKDCIRSRLLIKLIT
jgi:hypothetical protein